MHCASAAPRSVAKNQMKRHFAANGCSALLRRQGPDFYNENDPNDPINFEGATLDMIGDESEKGGKR